MKPKLYLETSIISYLTAKPSRNIIVAGHQAVTHHWWDYYRQECDLYVSQAVLDEASAGDTEQARLRLQGIEGIDMLVITDKVYEFANQLLQKGPLPEKARADAVHIACAIINGMDYLLTWNCRHIANAHFFDKINSLCAIMGYESVIICTPDELAEIEDG